MRFFIVIEYIINKLKSYLICAMFMYKIKNNNNKILIINFNNNDNNNL